MAKITYTDKTSIQTQPVPNENKVTSSDMNEIKASVNQNVDYIALKAGLNGSALETFEVAPATIASHAVRKSQLDSAIADLQGALIPQGNWNASTNTPDISATTETGYYWIVDTDGSTDIGGITDWVTNDWVVKTATGWAKIDNTDKILSVAGKTGVVTLEIADIELLADTLSKRLRIDVNNQNLTAQQKQNALTNLGINNHEIRVAKNVYVDTEGNADRYTPEVGNPFRGWNGNTYYVGKIDVIPFSIADENTFSWVVKNTKI